MLQRFRTRPRPVEHFDIDHADDQEHLGALARLGRENARLREDLAAWRLRYYVAVAGPGRLRWEPDVPQQREAPPAERRPVTRSVPAGVPPGSRRRRGRGSAR